MKTLKIALNGVLAVAMAFALILGAAPASYAQGPGGLTYSSGVQVQNIGSAMVNLSLNFIDQTTGNSVGTSSNITISVGSSKTYFPISNAPGMGSLTTFNGSMVVSADQPVAAIANLTASSFQYLDTTGGFNAGSTTFNLPLLMCNNGGFNTFFNVQNAGTADANIAIDYKPGVAGTQASFNITALKPGAATTLDQDAAAVDVNKTGPKCSGALGTRFVGGATITSNQPVVASVVQLNTSNNKQMIAYDGFTTNADRQGTTVAIPLLMSANGGFSTGLQIANTAATTATVNVAFTANTVVNSNTPVAEALTIGPGGSFTLLQSGGVSAVSPSNDWNAFGRYVGGATITSNQPVVAIVNQFTSGKGASFQGRPNTSGTAVLQIPLVMSQNGGFFTGVQIQNVGAANCASISLDFTANTVVNSNDPGAETVTNLASGASKTFLQNGGVSAFTSIDWTVFGRYVGGATITGTGCQLLAIVNQLGTGATDAFSAYNAFNITP